MIRSLREALVGLSRCGAATLDSALTDAGRRACGHAKVVGCIAGRSWVRWCRGGRGRGRWRRCGTPRGPIALEAPDLGVGLIDEGLGRKRRAAADRSIRGDRNVPA